MAPQHLLFVLLIDVVWGLNFVAARIGVSEIPPLLLITLRFTTVLVLLSPFLRWRRGMMLDMLIVGVLSGIMQFGLMFTGTALSTASVAAIMAQMQLPLATLLSIVLLKEQVRWRRWLGILLTIAGMIVLGFDPLIIHYWMGALLVCAASLTTALSQIYMRRMKQVGVLELQAWVAAVTAPGMLIISFLLERHRWHELAVAPLHIWGIVAYIAIGASILGQSGMFFLLKRYDVALVVTLTALAQVFGIIFGVVLLKEPMTLRVAIGAAIMCMGVVIISLRQGRARAPAGSVAVPLALAEPEVGLVPPPAEGEAQPRQLSREPTP